MMIFFLLGSQDEVRICNAKHQVQFTLKIFFAEEFGFIKLK